MLILASETGSGLTQKQRSLVVVVMILLCYIALGALVYSLIMNLTFQVSAILANLYLNAAKLSLVRAL